jgi:hypothetical protein
MFRARSMRWIAASPRLLAPGTVTLAAPQFDREVEAELLEHEKGYITINDKLQAISPGRAQLVANAKQLRR